MNPQVMSIEELANMMQSNRISHEQVVEVYGHDAGERVLQQLHHQCYQGHYA